MRIALRGWDAVLVDEEDELERKRTRYVLREGTARDAASSGAHAAHAANAPDAGVAACVAHRLPCRAPLPVHLSYLAEACRIEPWLRKAGIEHVHAHFGTNSAEVAMLVHVLAGRLELHRPWPDGIRQGGAHRFGGENPTLCLRGGDQLVRA